MATAWNQKRSKVTDSKSCWWVGFDFKYFPYDIIMTWKFRPFPRVNISVQIIFIIWSKNRENPQFSRHYDNNAVNIGQYYFHNEDLSEPIVTAFSPKIATSEESEILYYWILLRRSLDKHFPLVISKLDNFAFLVYTTKSRMHGPAFLRPAVILCLGWIPGFFVISTSGIETWIWIAQIVALEKSFKIIPNSNQFPGEGKSKIKF